MFRFCPFISRLNPVRLRFPSWWFLLELQKSLCFSPKSIILPLFLRTATISCSDESSCCLVRDPCWNCENNWFWPETLICLLLPTRNTFFCPMNHLAAFWVILAWIAKIAYFHRKLLLLLFLQEEIRFASPDELFTCFLGDPRGIQKKDLPFVDINHSSFLLEEQRQIVTFDELVCCLHSNSYVN